MDPAPNDAPAPSGRRPSILRLVLSRIAVQLAAGAVAQARALIKAGLGLGFGAIRYTGSYVFAPTQEQRLPVTYAAHPGSARPAIARLSDDVLLDIFLLFVPDTGPRCFPLSGPLLLTHVCHYWRALAVSYQQWWTRLDFPTDLPKDAVLEPMLAAFLRYAGAGLYDWHFGPRVPPRAGRRLCVEIGPYTALASCAVWLALLARCRSLTFAHDTAPVFWPLLFGVTPPLPRALEVPARVIASVLGTSATRMPALEALHGAEPVRYGMFTPGGLRAPRLRTLSIMRAGGEARNMPVVFDGAEWAQMFFPTVWSLPELLSGLPLARVETLTLAAPLLYLHDAPGEFVFPCLRTLVIESDNGAPGLRLLILRAHALTTVRFVSTGIMETADVVAALEPYPAWEKFDLDDVPRYMALNLPAVEALRGFMGRQLYNHCCRFPIPQLARLELVGFKIPSGDTEIETLAQERRDYAKETGITIPELVVSVQERESADTGQDT
jgi:hypothetical protein